MTAMIAASAVIRSERFMCGALEECDATARTRGNHEYGEAAVRPCSPETGLTAGSANHAPAGKVRVARGGPPTCPLARGQTTGNEWRSYRAVTIRGNNADASLLRRTCFRQAKK